MCNVTLILIEGNRTRKEMYTAAEPLDVVKKAIFSTLESQAETKIVQFKTPNGDLCFLNLSHASVLGIEVG